MPKFETQLAALALLLLVGCTAVRVNDLATRQPESLRQEDRDLAKTRCLSDFITAMAQARCESFDPVLGAQVINGNFNCRFDSALSNYLSTLNFTATNHYPEHR